ncbi:hypothetical protein SDC9_114522 [bioreactor metagenome]|uniref:Uncharacterized protein n=1 Tax=bioreactor metagenome TaxID=1076179 RepID=A0A645BR57_9ZZZZ
MLEQLRQNLAQGVALLDKQFFEQLAALAGVVLEGVDFLHLGGSKAQLHVGGKGYQIRLRLARRLAGEHPDTGGQIVVDLHKPHGNQAVKPGIGHLLHDGVVAFFRNLMHQILPLAQLRAVQAGLRAKVGGKHREIPAPAGWLGHGIFRNADNPGLINRHGNQLFPCADGNVFNCCFVHEVTPPFILATLS